MPGGPSDGVHPMLAGERAGPAAALVDLWDRMVTLAERVGPGDWEQPTPCPGMDVGGLVDHVATARSISPAREATPEATPERLLDRLRATRQAQVLRTAGIASVPAEHHDANGSRYDRVLGAACLDLWLHTHDLASALGAPPGLDEDSAAVQEACRYLLRLTPAVFALRSGAQEGATIRIRLDGAVAHDAALMVREGRGCWRPHEGAAPDAVAGTPAALILLLSGRGDPQRWRAGGALTWSGAGGEAFVRAARLSG